MYFCVLQVNFSDMNSVFNSVNIKKHASFFTVYCFRAFLCNERTCYGRCGFSAERGISIRPLSTWRWNCAAKNRAFFRMLRGAFLAVDLHCSSSLSLRNWWCLSLEVPEKAEKCSQLHCNFWEMRGLDCRCIDCVCHMLQLCILLLFRCHR